MADFINCGNSQVTELQLQQAILAKEGTEFGVRVIVLGAANDDAIDCSNNGLDEDSIFKKVIGIDADGKPAIRVAIKKVALIHALGVLSFTNNTTAGAGGLIVGDIYYNTTTSKLVTKLT